MKKVFLTKGIYIFLLIVNLSFANVTLPSILSSGMVLQQNSTVKIWGWGDPLEEIQISASWDDKVIKTVADSYAQWQVIIDTPTAGGPFEIKIQGYNEIILSDILIGEVWICSGQSNMAWTASSGIDGAEAAIKEANFSNIRLFNVVKKSADSPQNDVTGNWQVCEPETMKNFSAVGYFFAKGIHENLHIPIGIINASWGGTPAETWIPQEIFQNNDSISNAAKILKPQPWSPEKPSKVFNAMIAPLVNLSIAGVIWYQGEANTANPSYYENVFKSLILSWREIWNKDLPFYYVQIAPYTYGTPFIGVQVRDVQRRVLRLPFTGMVVTSDIGNIDDIHPKNKIDVGLRLANLALQKHYKISKEPVESPLFEKLEIKGNKVTVFFKNSEGLYFKQNSKELFEIAGDDGVFYSSKAKIKDGSIITGTKKVKNPKYVRFAWTNTSISNLFNAANLPASSFTTLP